MPERAIVFTSVALRDLIEIRDYVRRNDSEAASRLVDELEQRIGLLASFPFLGKVFQDRLWGRYHVLVVNNYLVFYLVSDDQVQIRRVIHGTRRYEFLLE
ncbi:MAG: type II toxin-antitoxin system RelE/ParE family toxin [Firmicutes bacterium]|nr:type II toxin-antitoxin system RelE/ParE family toxin [Bacillota bacterium]